jgi:PPM family protein phosphatase
MTLPSIEKPNPLLIRAQAIFALGNYQIEVLSYLGLLTAGVHHFQVKIQDLPNIDAPEAQDDVRLGLLRVGSIEGGLSRELELRQILTGYGLIAPLLGYFQVDSAEINSPLLPVTIEADDSVNSEAEESTENIDGSIDPIATDLPEGDRELEDKVSILIDNLSTPEEVDDAVEGKEIVSDALALEDNLPTVTEQADDNAPGAENVAKTSSLEISPSITTSSEYLEEETYPEEEIHTHTTPEKLLLLTDFPKEELTLEHWFKAEHAQAEEIGLVIQLCQLFSHIAKQNWCAIDISPKFIEVGKPLRIFDLSSTYPKDEKLAAGMLGDYCAPELASSPNVNELMSSYTIGALFYQLVHRKLPELDRDFNLEIQPIPRIYQLLKISLSPDPQERFPISQLLNLLIELRNSLKTKKVQWDVASSSTVGLSTHRLQNEDSYGVRQQQLSNAETFLLGVVADGMGGMAQGDEASKIAVEVLLGSPVPKDFKTVEQRNGWLLDLFQQANRSISETIRNGGTTLSAVLAIDSELMLAHVGDSRIYLLRNGQIQQISEDHSLVAMKVANGEITEEESLTDPERNVLLKSLGSKKSLSDGYVQNLTRTIDAPSMVLENGDILLLCSDGVWDLVSKQDFQEIFIGTGSLQASVDKTIQLVIDRGASDNSTLLALRYLSNLYC